MAEGTWEGGGRVVKCPDGQDRHWDFSFRVQSFTAGFPHLNEKLCIAAIKCATRELFTESYNLWNWESISFKYGLFSQKAVGESLEGGSHRAYDIRNHRNFPQWPQLWEAWCSPLWHYLHTGHLALWMVLPWFWPLWPWLSWPWLGSHIALRKPKNPSGWRLPVLQEQTGLCLECLC